VSRTARFAIFLVGAGCIGVMMVLAFLDLPHFGSSFHPYRDRSVVASAAQHTANVISSINFDQRAIDTLGEETIFFGSVIGVAALLRTSREETSQRSTTGGRALESTRLAGYVLLPVTLIVGVDVVMHGQVTPGGGFQGGVVLSTGLHLLYVAGSYPALERVRPEPLFEYGDALGAAAFAGLGVAGIVMSSAFLKNVLPLGKIGQLFSAGTVPVLNVAVGIEVGCGVMLLLARFLEQAIEIGGDRGRQAQSESGAPGTAAA
jgi:multicomponent Na+:H+ antiporter subunit B